MIRDRYVYICIFIYNFVNIGHGINSIIVIVIIIIIIIIISQCMKREMLQCCGIKQYTQTEKLPQIGQI